MICQTYLFFLESPCYFTFQSMIPYTIGLSPTSVAIADFNGDNRPDLAVSNSGNNSVSVLIGFGNGSFAAQKVIPIGNSSAAQWVAVGDFNGDRQADLVVANPKLYTVALLIGHRNGSFQSPVAFSTEFRRSPIVLAVGDVNGDSWLDVVVLFYFENIGVLLGNENGTFGTQTIFFTGIISQPIVIAVGDFNRDGCVDIAVVYYYIPELAVFFASNNGSFRPPTMYSIGTENRSVSIAIDDFNNDGYLDIAIAKQFRYIIVLLGRANGTFEAPVFYSVVENLSITSIAVGDFNGDTYLDIAVAGSSDKVFVLLGYENGTFQTTKTFPTNYKGSSAMIAVNDFNRDGCLDVAVVQQLNNTLGILLNRCQCPLLTY